MTGPSKPAARALEAVASDVPAPVEFQEVRRQRERERTAEALALRLAGLTRAQIADRLEISGAAVSAMLDQALEREPPSRSVVQELRALENARLDRAQAAIWSQVLEGDLKAVDAFLRISQRRSRLNGLDSPIDIALSVTVRQEMENALSELEAVVLHNRTVMGEVLDAAES